MNISHCGSRSISTTALRGKIWFVPHVMTNVSSLEKASRPRRRDLVTHVAVPDRAVPCGELGGVVVRRHARARQGYEHVRHRLGLVLFQHAFRVRRDHLAHLARQLGHGERRGRLHLVVKARGLPVPRAIARAAVHGRRPYVAERVGRRTRYGQRQSVSGVGQKGRACGTSDQTVFKARF